MARPDINSPGIVIQDSWHAARIFDPTDYNNPNAVTSLPTSKDLFLVEFKFNNLSEVGRKYEEDIQQSFLMSIVRSVTGGGINTDVAYAKDHRNKKITYHTGLSYNDLSLTIADSADGRARHLYNLYRRYYFGSGWDSYKNGDKEEKEQIGSGFHFHGYKVDDEDNVPEYLLQYVRIVSLYGGPQGQVIEYVNPLITTFQHGGHSYDEDGFNSFDITLKPQSVALKTFNRHDFLAVMQDNLPFYDDNIRSGGKHYHPDGSPTRYIGNRFDLASAAPTTEIFLNQGQNTTNAAAQAERNTAANAMASAQNATTTPAGSTSVLSGAVGTGAVGGTAGNTATTAKKAVQEKQKEKSFLDSLRENVPGFDGYVQIVTDALPDFTNINSVANFRASDLKNVPDRLGNRAKWQGTGFVEETAKEEWKGAAESVKDWYNSEDEPEQEDPGNTNG